MHICIFEYQSCYIFLKKSSDIFEIVRITQITFSCAVDWNKLQYHQVLVRTGFELSWPICQHNFEHGTRYSRVSYWKTSVLAQGVGDLPVGGAIYIAWNKRSRRVSTDMKYFQYCKNYWSSLLIITLIEYHWDSSVNSTIKLSVPCYPTLWSDSISWCAYWE